MKFLIFIILISTQTSILAQNEVIQDELGGIYFIYSSDGSTDSIKLVTSRSQKLASYKIKGDEVLFILESWAYIGWRRYKVNMEDQSSFAIYRDAISRGDRNILGNLYFVIDKNLNRIDINSKETNEELVSVEYKPQENIVSINKKYINSQENKPLVYSPLVVTNKKGKVVSRN